MAEQFSSSKVIHLVLSFERYRNDLVSIINNKDIFNIGDFVLSTRISLNNQQSDAQQIQLVITANGVCLNIFKLKMSTHTTQYS
jgi:hypothetical protein